MDAAVADPASPPGPEILLNLEQFPKCGIIA
jgi:hypothetical protein